MGHERTDGGTEGGEAEVAAAYDVLSGRNLRGESSCTEALDTLYWYLDGELTVERRVTIRRHLEICHPCGCAFDFEAELKAVIAKRCRDQVPDALRQRVAQALADAHRSGGTGAAGG